jgi:protein-disulfide isomerase
VPLIEQVLKKYPDSVKVVFKNYPLNNHKFARKAAAAALAADLQGKFWEYQDRLFANMSLLSDAKIRELAREVGMNEAQFLKDLDDPKTGARVSKDVQDGNQADVRGTPTVFINGRLLTQRSLEGFVSVIEKELRKTGKRDQ